MIKIKNLVFEGGGVKGAAYVGAIEILEKEGILDNIERIAGASAGAIVALLLGLGFCANDVATMMTKSIKLEEFKDSNRWTFIGKGFDITNHFGIYKGDVFESWAKDAIKKITGNPDATFRDLHEKRLQDLQQSGNSSLRYMYFIGTNLSTGLYEVFSHEHTPDMPIALAVRISMAIPLFFAAKRYGKENDLYVDGGLLNNYPITLFDNEREQNVHTLGFRVDSPEEIALINNRPPSHKKNIDSIKTYGFALFEAMTNVATNQLRYQDEAFRTIYINTLDVHTTDFDISDEKQKILVQQGRNATQDYLNRYRNQTSLVSSAQRLQENKKRLDKQDRYRLYEKAETIQVAKLDESNYAQIQLVFNQKYADRITKYVARLEEQTSVHALTWSATAENEPQTVLSIIAAAPIAEEIRHWMKKYHADDKSRPHVLPTSALIRLRHYQQPSYFVQQRPVPTIDNSQQLYDAVCKQELVALDRLLKEGTSPLYRDNAGQIALHIAAERGLTLFIETLLLFYPAEQLQLQDYNGETALHALSHHADEMADTVNYLINKGIDINAINKYGATALHRAVRWGQPATVSKLIEAGADTQIKDKDQHTPLAIASLRLEQAAQEEDSEAVTRYQFIMEQLELQQKQYEHLQQQYTQARR